MRTSTHIDVNPKISKSISVCNFLKTIEEMQVMF